VSEMEDYKQQIVEFGRKMLHDQLVRGTSGNLSVIDRNAGIVAITPTGTNYEYLSSEQVTVLTMTGERLAGHAPSSEYSMHLAIYRARDDVRAIVHTHSMYATSFAVHGKPIPAIHYMITMMGGAQIPITPHYELYGTEALAKSAVKTLGRTYHATLLRNHGVITTGATLAEAYQRAVVVEEMAELYHHALAIGEPVLLTEKEIRLVSSKIAQYGKMQE